MIGVVMVAVSAVSVLGMLGLSVPDVTGGVILSGVLLSGVRVIVVAWVRHDVILPKGSMDHNRIPLGGIPVAMRRNRRRPESFDSGLLFEMSRLRRFILTWGG